MPTVLVTVYFNCNLDEQLFFVILFTFSLSISLYYCIAYSAVQIWQ